MPTKSPTIISDTTKKLIIEKTPREYVKTRPGAFGKSLSYVETGYVIQKLNEIFAYNWNFEISEQTIGNKQIFVKGRLTGNLLKPDGSFFAIVKEQYGGIDIKFRSMPLKDSTGRPILDNYNKPKTTPNYEAGPISVADDLKAAGSDALKKCASMFGIAADIFWPAGNEYEHEEEPPRDRVVNTDPPSEKQVGMYFALQKELGHEAEEAKTYAKDVYGVESFTLLSKDQVGSLIDDLVQAQETMRLEAEVAAKTKAFKKDVPQITNDQKIRIISLLGEKGKTLNDLQKALVPFKRASYTELSSSQAASLIKKMESLPTPLTEEEEPPLDLDAIDSQLSLSQ